MVLRAVIDPSAGLAGLVFAISIRSYSAIDLAWILTRILAGALAGS